MTYYLLFVSGTDQPGIVAAVTGVLYRTGLNIHDSTMTRLGNTFGMILVLSAEQRISLSNLRNALKEHTRPFHLRMDLQRLDVQDIERDTVTVKEAVLTLIGADRTGIVYRVAALLAKKQVNILTVRTETAPGAGGTLYIMVMELEVPRSVRIPGLRASLRKLSKSLQVEIHLRMVEAMTL